MQCSRLCLVARSQELEIQLAKCLIIKMPFSLDCCTLHWIGAAGATRCHAFLKLLVKFSVEGLRNMHSLFSRVNRPFALSWKRSIWNNMVIKIRSGNISIKIYVITNQWCTNCRRIQRMEHPAHGPCTNLSLQATFDQQIGCVPAHYYNLCTVDRMNSFRPNNILFKSKM